MSEDTSVTKFLDNPQKLLEHISETRNFDIGWDYVRVVYDVVSKFDATLDIVLKGMEDLWKPDEQGGQSFYEAAVRMTPLAPVTIQRHTRVGRMLDAVPESVRPRIESMDFKSKIYIASLTEDNVPVTDEQWGRIAEQPSYQGVAEEIHKVKGTEPRSQWCRFLHDDDGVIWAATSKGVVKVYEPSLYDNPEIDELMNWVQDKVIRKLGATPK